MTWRKMLCVHCSRVFYSYSIERYSLTNLGATLTISMILCCKIKSYPASRLISKSIWFATAWTSLWSILICPLNSLAENGMEVLFSAFLLFLNWGIAVKFCCFSSAKESLGSASFVSSIRFSYKSSEFPSSTVTGWFSFYYSSSDPGRIKPAVSGNSWYLLRCSSVNSLRQNWLYVCFSF